MKKIITIVVPTYNMEALLEKDLNTLIIEDKDMLKKVEILVVIDGAKDRSSEIAHSFQDRYPDTFRVIDKENGNYGSCVNRGLYEAVGKYVSVMDADDYYDTRVFQSYISFLQNVDADLVLNNHAMVDATGRVFHKKAIPLPARKNIDLLSLPFGYNLNIHNVAYKTEKLKAIGYKQTEGMSYTDMEWMLTPMVTVQNVAYFPGFLYMYLVGREGQTMDINVYIKNIKQHILMLKNNLESYRTYYPKLSKAGKRYFDSRLSIRIKKIYETFLLDFPHLDRNILIDVDKMIKIEYPEIYLLGNEISASSDIYPSFKFIKVWRKNYSTNNIRFKIYRLISISRKYKKKIQALMNPL